MEIRAIHIVSTGGGCLFLDHQRVCLMLPWRKLSRLVV